MRDTAQLAGNQNVREPLLCSLAHLLIGEFGQAGFREMVRNAVSSGPNTSGRQLAFHLNTAPTLKIQASADFSNHAAPDGTSGGAAC